MAESAADDYRVCVAMDIGTTFSSYAYSFRESSSEIKVCDSWGSGLGVAGSKAPTVVLVRNKTKFVAFGYEAQEKYAEMDEEEVKEGTSTVY
jgi:hypothetical protein